MPKSVKPIRITKYRQLFNHDVKQFGRDIAIYNNGYLIGHDESYSKGFTRACLLITGDKIKWTTRERKLFNKITRKLFGKKRPK